MSQQNVESVRAFVRAFVVEFVPDRHVEWPTYVDPAIVWNPTEVPATLGMEAFVETMTLWVSTWEEYSVTSEGFEDMGDRVVATLDFHGRGRGSGVEIEARFYEVYTVRDGKILRMDEFTDRSEALEAAGLRE
jgi:ketosteroid isomerase-like protein